MILREVTVGRSKDCDIYLDPRCNYASNHHGTIYYDGNRLMFRDTSTNGTMINNVSVKNRAVPIQHGDVIMLAGRYLLNWNQIDGFFPNIPQPQVYKEVVQEGTQFGGVTQERVPKFKWNWGAFGLFPIWGFFNGCWWGILVSMFLGWLYPIPNLIFGMYGSRWAWENKKWSSVDEFEQAQSTWTIAGVIFTSLGLIIWLFYICVYASVIASTL